MGIATFDTTVHFYSLIASQSQAQMLVMPDVDDVYSLGASSLIVPLQPSFLLVTTLERLNNPCSCAWHSQSLLAIKPMVASSLLATLP